MSLKNCEVYMPCENKDHWWDAIVKGRCDTCNPPFEMKPTQEEVEDMRDEIVDKEIKAMEEENI